ncbi:MAG: hypothetical protein ACM3PX_04530 [Omnitrophica WOR_2 bacterium]|jgi:hypothetical protein
MTKRRRVRRFRSVNFKFTIQQKRKIDAYCRKNGTTPIRMYKKAIKLFLSNNGYGENFQVEPEPANNQLTIFDLINEDVITSEV